MRTFSHVPVATVWGTRCGRGARRPRRAEVRVTCSLSRAAHRPPLCSVPRLPAGGSGVPAVPPSTWPAGEGRAHVTVIILSAPALRLAPSLRVAPAADLLTEPEVRVACPACMSRNPDPGPSCRPKGSWLECGQPGGSPGPQHSGSCCRPETTWPHGVDPGPATSDRRLLPCSVLWLAGARAPFSPTFGGVAGARAQAQFLARRPRALPASEGRGPPPPTPELRSAAPSPWCRAELAPEVSCRPQGHVERVCGHLPGAHLG